VFGSSLTRLLRCHAGTTAVMFALSLPAMMGAVGIASDFAIYNMKLEKLQAAADDAALAGAKEFSVSTSTPSSISAAAQNFALASYGASTNIGITAKTDPAKKTVTVDLNEVWSPFFAHFLGATVTPVVAHATASAAGRGNICVLLLDPSGSKAGHVLVNSKITANGCDIYSNSTAADGITVNAGAVVTDNATCSVGGVLKEGIITPAPTTDCPVVADPLASRPAPSFGGCDFTNYKINNGTATVNPGTYCGGILVAGNSTLTFSPGTYIIKDGEFKMTGTSTIKGIHVGFYLTGDLTVLRFTGNSSVNLTGADTGAMSGLLFFEDRAAPLGRQHRINSNNASNLTGTMYFPRGNLLIDPGSKVGEASAYTAIVARQLLVRGGPELILNSNYSATDVPVPTGIKATEQVVLLK
jgi:Flp pilus assembly protein TadG